MLRFSIRDLLWLTLTVAIVLGWLVRERQLRVEKDRLSERAVKWRMAAGALEHYFIQIGWQVKWNWNSSEVVLEDSSDGHKVFGKTILSTTSHEPSSPD